MAVLFSAVLVVLKLNLVGGSEDVIKMVPCSAVFSWWNSLGSVALKMIHVFDAVCSVVFMQPRPVQ